MPALTTIHISKQWPLPDKKAFVLPNGFPDETEDDPATRRDRQGNDFCTLRRRELISLIRQP